MAIRPAAEPRAQVTEAQLGAGALAGGCYSFPGPAGELGPAHALGAGVVAGPSGLRCVCPALSQHVSASSCLPCSSACSSACSVRYSEACSRPLRSCECRLATLVSSKRAGTDRVLPQMMS